MYFLQVGVGKNFQNGIFNSSIPTFLKNVKTALINSKVSGGAFSSRQPNLTSNATLAIAVLLERKKKKKIKNDNYYLLYMYKI